MTRYRKKPIEIEAMQISASDAPSALSPEISLNDASVAQISGWMLAHGFRDFRVAGVRRPFGISIETLEGDMLAQPGDYIIRGVQGEFYPCKPDIFEQTYEPVS